MCGDEVNGACTQLREYLEDHGQAYVLQISSSFRLSLPGGVHSPASRRRPAGSAWLGDPLRRDGIQRAALVRLGVDGMRFRLPPPADPARADYRASSSSVTSRTSWAKPWCGGFQAGARDLKDLPLPVPKGAVPIRQAGREDKRRRLGPGDLDEGGGTGAMW